MVIGEGGGIVHNMIGRDLMLYRMFGMPQALGYVGRDIWCGMLEHRHWDMLDGTFGVGCWSTGTGICWTGHLVWDVGPQALGGTFGVGCWGTGTGICWERHLVWDVGAQALGYVGRDIWCGMLEHRHWDMLDGTFCVGCWSTGTGIW